MPPWRGEGAHPGPIEEVTVDRRDGRLLIEVDLIDSDVIKRDVCIDPETSTLVT